MSCAWGHRIQSEILANNNCQAKSHLDGDYKQSLAELPKKIEQATYRVFRGCRSSACGKRRAQARASTAALRKEAARSIKTLVEIRDDHGEIRNTKTGATMAAGDFNNALARTFHEEGGVLEADTNGTPSNMGINQAAHPEVNVKNLSRDQAAAIYKKDYWNSIGGDLLPPQLAHVAFDTAVIAGPQVAKDMLNRAGGDPQKFMDLREQFLNRLLQKDPGKYGRFANAWNQRNANLRADIGAAGGSGLTADGGGVPFTREQIAQNPFLLSYYIKSSVSDQSNLDTLANHVGAGILQGLKAGIMPDETTLANFMQLAARDPKQFGDMSEQIRTQIVGNSVGSAAGEMNPAGGQALIDRAMQQAQGGPIAVQQAALAARDAYARGQKDLKDDPFNEAAKRGWIGGKPIPLNFQNPDELATGFAQRAQAALTIGAKLGDPGQSMVSPQELDQVSGVMQNGTVDQKLAVLSSITQAGVPEAVRTATLQQLAKKSETQALAAAGYVARENPEAAKGILMGDQILHSEGGVKYGPGEKEAVQGAQLLPAAAFPNLDALDGVMRAAKAYYAKLSFDAGDASGKINEDRYKQALNAVTGGVLNYRGGSIIAPWYGATNNDLHAALQAVPDKAFDGVMLGDGVPFTKNMIVSDPTTGRTAGNQTFALQNVGDGKYAIYAGPNRARQYVQAPMTLGGDSGGRFVLDLGQYRGRKVPQGIDLSLPPPSVEPVAPIWKGAADNNVLGKQITLPVSPEMGQAGRADTFKP